jgi:hypothetical protein
MIISIGIGQHVAVRWKLVGSGVESMSLDEKRHERQRAREGKAFRKGHKRRIHLRQAERRKFFRVVYPLTLAPKTLDGKVYVINLSRQGVMLRQEGDKDECVVNLVLGSMAHLQIQFHDGEIVHLAVKITRCQSEVRSRRTVWSGILQPVLSAKRISKEQAYLLRHVPEFCRVAWYSADRLRGD